MPKALHNVGLAITSISVAAPEWNCKLLFPSEKSFHTMHRVPWGGFMENLQKWAIGDDMGVEYLRRGLAKSISHIIILREYS